jgi:hypothetical protein
MRISLFSLVIVIFLTISATAKLCPENDLNGDCEVDWEDIQTFTDQWLNTTEEEDDCPQPGCADLDNTGEINLVDFAILANQWLCRGIPLSINEIVASNNIKKDPQNEYDDWFEIYNFGDMPINLAGMYLTDNLSNPTKWQIPYGYPSQTTVPADGFILFWADEDTIDGPNHVDFKLSAGGEEIGLFLDADTMVDSIIFGEQATNISYGRYPDADDYLRYFAVTTPLADNNGTYFDFVNEIGVSHERGFYDSPFNLLLACDTNGATIRYTLSGTEPSETVGTVYTPGTGIPITTTANLRAIAYKAGEKPSRTTHTYIFINDVVEQPNNPPGWPSNWGYSQDVNDNDGSGNGIVPSDYEMDQRVVDNTLPGYSVQDALLDIPTVSITMKLDDFIGDANGMWANPGYTTEYKCSIEYIPLDGTEGFQYDCKVENHGGASRRPYRMQKHNLRLTFTSQYGPAKLEYNLFPESPVDVFNQLLLRASFTDSWGLVSWGSTRYRPNDSMYIRDFWMKESLRDMGQPSSYGNFVHLYVNGLYFGQYNLTERVAAGDFFAEHLGGEPEDWAINEDFDYGPTPARWTEMLGIDPSTEANYTQIKNYLDIENFADYMLLHFYADAEDWPGHNGHAAANPVSGDGKFRFFVWDQEIVLDYHGRAADRVDSTGGAGTLFQNMRKSAEFRLLFADRFQKHCMNDGALNVANSQNRYLEAANIIDKAIVAESARWGDTRMKTPYGSSINIPTDPNNWNDIYYPAPPHGPWPNYYFTREDSWLLERDCVINHYIPDINNTANSYALIKLLRTKNLYPTLDAPVFNVNGSYKHGGYISTSDTLTITDSCSTAAIYYTLDGNDPRVPGEVVPPHTIVLVSDGSAKKARVPTGDIGTTWQGGSEPYDDSNWTSGTSGVGYERDTGYDPFIGIDVETAMYNVNTTCYIRIPFYVDACDIGKISSLTLRMRQDDGYVLYINGVEVKRVYSPGTPAWNSNSTSMSPESTSAWYSYDFSSHIDKLHSGSNILAIHGMNYSVTDTDFLICAELEAVIEGSTTDPTISPDAIEYTGGFNIDKSAALKARAYLSSTQKWSALNEAVYEVGNIRNSLRITEIMYHPVDTNNPNDPNTEYIEMKNINASTINLNLVKFDKGIDFTFGPNTLMAGQHILAVKNKNAFEAKYGAGKYIAGEYTGSLDNGGERIRLLDAVGTTILDFDYKDGWRSIVDGDGYSLTIIEPTNPDMNSWSEKDSWRASAYVNGSPGWNDSGIIPNPGAIAINEVMAHSHAGAPDWIELYNTTASVINIGGWYLSDNDENPLKYRFAAGKTIPAYGYIVIYEDVNFGPLATDPGRLTPFALSENGEMVCLASALDTNGVLTGYREKEDFGASETGVSFGRYYKGSTDSFNFVPMANSTQGYANAYPKVGPIVITEIMYHPDWPAGSLYENDQYEYVELRNIGTEPVTLYDYAQGEPWKLTDGIDFTFPASPVVTIPAGGRILVVKNPTAFNWRYPGLSAITYGPYDGKLDNAGERIQIGKPGDEDAGIRYYIRVDRVDYSDGSHPGGEPGNVDLWPAEADGAGKSLTRISTTLYGNDPNNWQAVTPTPGS